MELDQIASYFDSSYFDVFDITSQTWSNQRFLGQLKISDDFISIFNRPTRRRMLTVKPDIYAEVSTMSVIRESLSKTIYLVGDPQYDIETSIYRVTMPLNKVSGIATVNRLATQGPSNNPGILISSGITPVFTDKELRTITSSGDTEGSEFGRYFMWFPKDADILKNDQLVFDGDPLRITDTYKDTGFLGARATTEPDSRQTFTYIEVLGSPTYSTVSGTYTPNETTYQISAELLGTDQREARESKMGKLDYTIVVENKHIGVTPKVGDLITISGTRVPIIRVSGNRHNESWKLELLQ